MKVAGHQFLQSERKGERGHLRHAPFVRTELKASKRETGILKVTKTEGGGGIKANWTCASVLGPCKRQVQPLSRGRRRKDLWGSGGEYRGGEGGALCEIGKGSPDS